MDVRLLRLYFVSAELPIEPEPPEDSLRSTSLWRGYIGTWRLNLDGTLYLLKFSFPRFIGEGSITQEFPPVTVHGDFELTFRPFFYGPNTRIPFVDGLLVEDRDKWSIDDQAIEVQAYKTLDESGLIVQTLWGPGYVPRSMLLDPARNLEAMLGQRFHCEISDYDDERRTWILREVEAENRE